jgi:succinate-acetate transporter protein
MGNEFNSEVVWAYGSFWQKYHIVDKLVYSWWLIVEKLIEVFGKISGSIADKCKMT